jgi:uncharacterized protein with ATP-grasp and redox domains
MSLNRENKLEVMTDEDAFTVGFLTQLKTAIKERKIPLVEAILENASQFGISGVIEEKLWADLEKSVGDELQLDDYKKLKKEVEMEK